MIFLLRKLLLQVGLRESVIHPTFKPSRSVVVADMPKDLSAEKVRGGENASGDSQPLDLGQPNFER